MKSRVFRAEFLSNIENPAQVCVTAAGFQLSLRNPANNTVKAVTAFPAAPS